MTQPNAAPAAPTAEPGAQAAPADPVRSGPPINEDWAATLVGLALVVLVLAGVIGKGLIP
jgi:hypothetical protein